MKIIQAYIFSANSTYFIVQLREKHRARFKNDFMLTSKFKLFTWGAAPTCCGIQTTQSNELLRVRLFVKHVKIKDEPRSCRKFRLIVGQCQESRVEIYVSPRKYLVGQRGV